MPSINFPKHLSNSYCTSGIQQKAVYQSGSVQHRETQSFTFTPKANLESPIKLTSIALWEKVRVPSRHREIMETPQRKGLAQESSNLLIELLN